MRHRELTIREQGQFLVPDLTEEQATALIRLGQELRGSGLDPGEMPNEGDQEEPASIIQVIHKPGEKGWRISVSNAVGIVGVDDLQILVEPKIPNPHFEFVSALALDPERLRLADGRMKASSSSTYLGSVWLAFIDALVLTLRADLHHDYVEVEDDPPYVRGRLDVRRVVTNLNRGVMRFPTQFEDLSVDNPVNRILRAACKVVAEECARLVGETPREGQSPQQAAYRRARRRAVEAGYHLAQAGDLRVGDLDAEVPRLATHQVRALHLAKHILEGVGRTFRQGESLANCFLHSTPPIIESGIRRLLADHLGKEMVVSKFSRTSAGLSFNPDLVVSSSVGSSLAIMATGDVKYRIRKEDWPRPVLEQAVVFAEVFGAAQGFFIDFDTSDSPEPAKTAKIDDRHYHRVSWPAGEGVDPEDSARHVVSEVRRILATVG